MKKYELKVRFGRKVMYHHIFEFTEDEQQSYLQKIVETGGCTGNLLSSELEDVLCRHMGEKWYFKEYPSLPDPLSLHERGLKELAEKHPDMLVAAALQEQCYNSFSYGASDFPTVCNKNEVLVDATETFSYRCKILN